MDFCSIMCEKHLSNDHHFPVHKYGLFQTLQFFSGYPVLQNEETRIRKHRVSVEAE